MSADPRDSAPPPDDTGEKLAGADESAAGSPSLDLNDLVAACLERYATEGESALESMCREHPQRADSLRQRLETLRQIGMLDELRADEAHASQPEFPERLGDFRLIRRLGSGGMGVVFLAEQESLHREVALKLVRPDQLYFEGARHRFQREVEAAARLQHPGIVPVYTVGEEAGVPYFAMERIAGASLEAVLKELQHRAPASLRGSELRGATLHCMGESGSGESSGGPAGASPGRPIAQEDEGWVQTCFRITLQVAQALEHAHSRGVVHRDIKPSNVMLTRDGRAMLLDFGLSSSRESGRLTRTGSVLGSLAYMSPEQLEGRQEQIDERCDVYSLGVSLYEALSLRLPYLGKDAEATARLIHRAEPAPLRSLNPAVPWDAETVCLTAMDPARDRRYASARAFAQDLRNFLDHRPITARRPGALLRARRWMQRKPTVSVALAATAVVVLGLAAFGLRQRSLNRELVLSQAATNLALDGERDARLLAEKHYEDVVRLADRRQLEELRTRQDTLWPVHPDQVPALQSWIQDAERLALNLPLHRDSLARLERETAAGAELGEGGFRLTGVRRLWLLENLRELVQELESFSAAELRRGNLTELRDRCRRSQSLRRRSIEDWAEEWEMAIDDVALSSRYDGLEIDEQLGLVPLGLDPDSDLMEFWVVDTGDRPERDLDTEKLILTPEVGIVLVLLPGGTFHFGAQRADPDAPNHDRDADVTEGPVIELSLPAFLLSKYELTQSQWTRIEGVNPSFFQPGNDVVGELVGDTRLHPVDQISWDDGVRFLRTLGLCYPTEAHWEYACRAETDTVWFTGDDVDSLKGHLNLADEGSVRRQGGGWTFDPGFDDGSLHHTEIGSFLPNDFGLHDMHGNMAEFCITLGKYIDLDPEQPPELADDDPTAISRVLRGGRFDKRAIEARCANREYFALEARNPTFGLRPARPLER